MNKTFWRVMSVALLALGLLTLAACGPDAGQMGMVVPFTPSATLIPEFIATPQAAQAAAQATLFYGQAEFIHLDRTATALSIGREAVALELTRAAATDWHFATQTQGARDATGTAQAETAAAHTAQADAWALTATATAQFAAEAIAYAEKQAILAITQAAAQDAIHRLNDAGTAQMLRGASPRALPNPQEPSSPAETIDAPQVRLLPPDDPELRGWLNDIAPFLLDDGESE
jgi:hypothetical protein